MPPDAAAGLKALGMIEEEAWPDPEPLFEPTETERAYPLDALPPIAAKAVAQYQTYGQQPLSLVGCSALASVSLAAQALADVARDRHLTGPTSLYLLNVADSGERKTSADRTFNRPIRDWVRERLEVLAPEVKGTRAGIAAWRAERDGVLNKIKKAAGDKNKAADLERLKQSLAKLEAEPPREIILPELFHEDTNAQCLAVDLAKGWPSASIWSDESGLVVGGNGMNDDNLMGFIALLNRLWDGNDFSRSRLVAKSAHIRGRRLTVNLMMQPVVLLRLLDARASASRGMGWIARNLLAWPTSTIGSRPYRDAAAMPLVEEFHARIRELLALPLPVEGAEMILTPPIVSLSPAAFQEWRALHDEIEAELSRVGEFGSVPDIGAKVAENAARIAALLHVLTRGPGGDVDQEMMERAASLSIWHLNEARRVVGATKTTQDIADAALLEEWLLSRQDDVIEPRDILRLGPSTLRRTQRRDAAMRVLIDRHRAGLVKVGGAEKLVLNPKLRPGK